jgi:hypothetical protein
MKRLAHLAVVLSAAGALLTGCHRPSDLPDGNVSRTKVDFQAPAVGENPTAETLFVSNSGRGTLEAPTVTISYRDGADWLTVTVTSSGDQYAIALQPVTAGLAAGTYRATLTLSWASGSAEPAVVSVTLVVPARSSDAARMGVSRTSVAIEAPGGSGEPGAETVYVVNSGGGALAAPTADITFQDGGGWLTATVSGTAAPYAVALQATSAKLVPGVHRATVTLACAGASASPAQVGVTLTVPDPRLQLSVDALAVDAPRGGGDPVAACFEVLNAGRGAIPVPSIEVAYAGAVTGWLSTSVAAASAGYAVTAQAHAAGIPSGVHQATLTVRAPGTAVPPRTLPVTFTVPPPEVSLSTRDVALRAPPGGVDVTATVAVANAGGGLLAAPVATISYEDGSAASWEGLLDVALSGTPARYQLTFTAHQVKTAAAGSSKLPPGLYTATVQVSAPGAATSDTARVTFEVPPPTMQLSSSQIAFAEYPSCPIPAPTTVSVANVGGGTLAAPVVVMGAGVDAWLAASVSTSGRDAFAVVLTPRAYPAAAGAAVETTVMITDPTGVASALPVRVRFDALTPDLSTAAATPTALTISAQVGMGDPAPRTLSIRTPTGCVSAPSVVVEAGDGFDPASWLSIGAVASSPHGYDVSVLTSVAGLAAGEQRRATVRLAASGRTWDVPVTLAAADLAPAGALLSTVTGFGILPSGSLRLTPLADGRALATGGGTALTQVFDPATRTWSAHGAMQNTYRYTHGAVQLDDGRVLVCGGEGTGISFFDTCEVGSLSSSQYTWSDFGSLTSGRGWVTLVTMPRGRVLVVSGSLVTPEVLDLATGRSTLLTGVTGTSAVKRPDGSILVAGGATTSWLYSPELDSWAAAGDMPYVSRGTGYTEMPALISLPDGRVMALYNYWTDTKIWNPRTNTWSSAAPPPNYNSVSAVTLLSSGKIVATSGRDLEVFDPATGSWSIGGAWASSNVATSMVRLSTGMVLFAGVHAYDSQSRTRYVTTPETYTW